MGAGWGRARRAGIAARGVGAPPRPPRPPRGLSFSVDDVRYRTVGTPTDFSGTGAPSFTYDKIYALGDGLINVAEAKPGDRDYNGGRWMVLPITWSAGVTAVQLTNAEDVEAWAADGLLT